MAAEMLPTQLRCEYLTNPLGIDVIRPRLSWVLHSNQRGQRQTAYQILVASSEELPEADQGDLWDSGKVNSPQSIHIVYGGKELTSRLRCWWKVRVWDKDGIPSSNGPTAWWEMGLLRTEDWQGQWIGLDQGLQEPSEAGSDANSNLDGLVPSPYLRKRIELIKPVSRARLYVTARGLYELHFNGERVGKAVLTPGWTDYNKRIQYRTYDVTEMVRQGDNVLGAILGTGWYSGCVGFGGQCQHYGSQMQFLLQLQLDYSDGTTEVFVTDGTWKGSIGQMIFSDLLMGETYDARRKLVGWDKPGFDDAQWKPVTVQDRGNTPLIADRAQPVQITEEIKAQAVTEVTPGVYVFDMGQNMVGWARLKVQGNAGTRVQLRFAEMVNPDGTIYTENLRAARQIDTYILKGNSEEVFEPHFTFHGFRYVEVIGYPGEPSLDAITGCIVHSATPPTATFECSNPMVNQLQHNIVWSQRGNFLSIPTDCPQRDERLGWLGDAQVFVRTACYNMDVAAFFTKWMIDVEDAQSKEGAFPDVAPRMVKLTDGAPAWGDAGIIVPWTIYQCYGDTRIIEQHYDALVRWMEYIHQANPDLLRTERLNKNYGDWLSIDADTPKDVLATAYFAYNAKLMSKMAQAIGRYDDARKYEALFQEVKAAFGKAYVASDGRIKGDTQTCYVLALYMNLLPTELRPLAVRHLVEDIEKRNWHLSTGFIGVGYLCPVLTEARYSDVAHHLLMTDTFPSWGYSIKHGATTVWERWDGWTEERGFQTPTMNSFNHYSLGAIGQWLYQSVAGIDVDPEKPGYQHIIIRPSPGDGLTYVRAEYDSVRGKITCNWRIENGIFTLSITIPANTTAAVYAPASDKGEITEGGMLAEQVPGVTFLRREGDRVVFEVESGTYEFQCEIRHAQNGIGRVRPASQP